MAKNQPTGVSQGFMVICDYLHDWNYCNIFFILKYFTYFKRVGVCVCEGKYLSKVWRWWSGLQSHAWRHSVRVQDISGRASQVHTECAAAYERARLLDQVLSELLLSSRSEQLGRKRHIRRLYRQRWWRYMIFFRGITFSLTK